MSPRRRRCWRRQRWPTHTNPGLRYAKGPMIRPAHDAMYWDRVTKGFDFSEADQVPSRTIQSPAVGRLEGRHAVPGAARTLEERPAAAPGLDSVAVIDA